VTITAAMAARVVPRMFVVIPPDTVETFHKAIVFDNDTAISVMCITAADVTQLRQWAATGQVRLRETDRSTLTDLVAKIITCPPPENLMPENLVTDRETDPRLDVSEKLDSLSAWAQGQFGSMAAAA
jgi:hypothetical protein